MIKKLLGVGLLAGCSFALSAASVNPCSLTVGTATATGNGAIATGTWTCPVIPALPGNDVLYSVELIIQNSFSQATAGNTNQVDFLYTVTGFNGVTTLTTSSASDPPIGNGNGGGATDFGGIVGGSPNGGAACTQAGAINVDCFETTPPALSSAAFTVAGISTWIVSNGNSTTTNGFTVYELYTYGVPAPEPASMMLVGGGLISLALMARKKRKA